MNLAEVHKVVFEITCLQKLITHTQKRVPVIISRRSTAGRW